MRLFLFLLLLLLSPALHAANVTTMRDAMMLGNHAYKKGQITQADKHFSQAFKDAVKVFGPMSQEVFRILPRLANIKFLLDKDIQGEALLRNYLYISKKWYADRPLAMAMAKTRVAELYVVKKDYIKAAQISGEAIETMVAKIGLDHPNVTQAIDRHGSHLNQTKQFKKSEKLLSKVLIQVEKRSGKVHFIRGKLLMTLGDSSMGQGHVSKALARYKEAHDIRVELYGYEHIETLSATSRLIDAGLAMGQHEAMRPHLLKGLAMARKLYSEKNPMVKRFKKRLKQLNRQQRTKEVAI
ncbi:tetratricopeptide repeat protein [Magnetococcus sp. PR-3]|uniref:tetratricopeptide repeat protein n=1 Tax=Magnetococcus sp. PR-3 TaxID=3120355 RepID=UPI002FCE657A